MGATYTEAQARAIKKHLSTLAEIKLRLPNDKKEEYAKRAQVADKSLNRFILDCVDYAISHMSE